MNKYLVGAYVIGADDPQDIDTTKKAVLLTRPPSTPTQAKDNGGMSWQMIAGIGLTVVASAIFLPRILKD